MRYLINNIGDLHPLEYGGALIYRCTGKHRGGAEYELDILKVNENTGAIECFTILLEPPNPVNREWFEDNLNYVGYYVGIPEVELRAMWASNNPVERAIFYQYLTAYFGAFEFHQYPEEYTAGEARRKYRAAFNRAKKRGVHISI